MLCCAVLCCAVLCCFVPILKKKKEKKVLLLRCCAFRHSSESPVRLLCCAVLCCAVKAQELPAVWFAVWHSTAQHSSPSVEGKEAQQAMLFFKQQGKEAQHRSQGQRLLFFNLFHSFNRKD